MSDNRYFLDNLWRWKCGLPELEHEPKPTVSYEDLRKSEWSIEFEELMRNRLVMGALRYGRIGSKGKPTYDRISSIIKRISNYKDTGNKEMLVDVANLCLLEYVECHHPKVHFHSEDDGEHVKTIK